MQQKIAIYLRDLLGGGVERMMLNLMEELVKKGYDIDLLLENDAGELLYRVPEKVTTLILSEESSATLVVEKMPQQQRRSRIKTSIKKPFVKLLCFCLSITRSEHLYITIRIMIRDFIKFKYNRKSARLYFYFLTRLKYSRFTSEITTNLIRYIKTVKPQTIITGLEEQNFRLIIAKYLSGNSVKCIISVRNHLTTYFPLYYKINWHRNYASAVRFLYPKADKIVAVSKGVKNDLVQSFGVLSDCITVIYNPVVTPNIVDRSTEYTKDDDWFNSDIPVILSVGRLHPQKRFEVLIQAVARVNENIPARLIILGNGAEKENLMALVNRLNLTSKVRFAGYQENPFSYMAKSSLFVLSSQNEGLPGVLIEAMACGCPVVASQCNSGPEEILDYGKWGTLVPVGEVDKLAKEIINALKKKHDKQLLMERAQFFSANSAVEHYIRMFESVNTNHL